MAGKLRIAAKLFLATTVLAAGGAGAYYGTTVWWPAMVDSAADDNARLAADATPNSNGKPLAAGDLDAVASAWAEPAPNRQEIQADSSAIARTADVALARAESVDTPVDRYALSANLAEPSAAAPMEAERETSQLPPETEAQPLPAEKPKSEPIDQPVDRLLVADSAPTPALARGQEPEDEALREVIAEPQPIPVAGREPNTDSSDQQAHDIPRDQSTAARNDRYGGAAAPFREPAIVNPFSSNPPSSAPTTNAPETIEPLPALPEEIDGQLSELPHNGDVEPVEDSDRSSRATGGNAAGDMFGGPRPRSNDDTFRAQRGETPPVANGLPAESLGPAAAGEGTGKPGERALEGAQRPALEIQKFAPGEIQVGKPAKFVVQVRNVGTQAAEGVTIRDEVPHGTRLISTTPSAETDGGHLVWELGKLSPGEDRTVELQLMPTAEGEIGSVATVSYSAQASVKTRCTMPQLAIRMTAPNKVMVGQEQRVKIELRNPGSGDATGVMLFENVPQNVKHAAGPALEFEIGTLKAGETRELELLLLAEKAGKTVNVLSARADGNLQVQQQVEFEVIAPELTVDVDGPERRYLERPATYEVSVENPGTAPAHDVQIITKLPKGLRFVRANNMGEYDAATHAVYWSLAELPEGERGTVELVAMPIETGAQTLEVESRAGQGLADQTQQEIVVDGLAAIMFELRDLEDPIEVGGETGYEIRVVNQGTKGAANLQVAINLPPGMQLVSAEGETQHTAQHGNILFDAISELAPKADTVYHIRVKGMQPGDQRVTVEVSTDDIAQPVRREESTRVFGDE